MNIERKLFGTDGVRWIVDKEMLDFALRLAMAIGSYFPKGSRALIGMDGRLGNPTIYGTILSALSASGSKVYDAGLLPTPALQYCIKEFGFDYGVMVTASHNPPEWVGIKLVLSDGIEAPPNVEAEVESILFESRFRRVQWHEVRPIEKFEGAIGYYIDAIKTHVDIEKIRKKQIKVVVDCANSVSALTTPRALKELGLKVLSINSDIGIPYRPYEPTPDNINELMNIVKTVNADFGVAHDGDGDRAIFIDNIGRFVPGDISAIILSWYVESKIPELPKRVVTAISTSHFLVEENLIKRGIEVEWTRVGFLNIARKIIELGGALSGFEDNGGFAYVPHQLIRDGTMTAVLMAEYLASTNTSLAMVTDSIKKPIVLRARLPLESREKGKKIVESIKEMYKNNRYIDIDGIKVISDNFAFIVRPSGTEPLIRITVESWDKDVAEKTLNNLITYIKSTKV